ncbi:MAG: murein transglycosylase A [Rhodospirillaceae bacterium]|jgi:membrane-bound lytic murein transglycosylase A|nr:murein transglycosylase A [Rhodospirillaceae bacterium]MBT5242993.1 murein transglycosylase A [Rhodospirillaceae bacterium]MBT5563218.1 murein transglycosylase A [Rhodospirillaceae bacterium]MBT6243532.1 murein transglycosylase A [Rhodospirillaceae bacterium]MBT7138019.1 murein transglycosylase A [Rhodospirillaceae bacterium]
MKGWSLALIVMVGACTPVAVLPPGTSTPVPESAPVAAQPPAQKLVLKKTSFNKITGWSGDRHDQVIGTLLRSCAKFAKMPADLSLGSIGGVAGDWTAPCQAAAALPVGNTELSRAFFEAHFQPYLATADGRPEGLFTGYFEIELKGSWLRKGPYTTPIYERPPELVDANLGDFNAELKGKRLSGKVVAGRFVPFDDRAAIDAGALSGRGLEMIWVDSPVDAFFLHVQGSGRVIMDDGSIVRIGFAAKNGHAYKSIGRELIKSGALTRERVSMQSIKAWLHDNPEKGAALMASNPSFIFFRVIDGALKSLGQQQGPIGAQGVPLTPGRSLAVDRGYFPLGIPIWLDTTDPLDPGAPLRRLVIAQDTGSAIKGPVRGDLFWGFGAAAATRAGLMKQPGHYFLLLPRQ